MKKIYNLENLILATIFLLPAYLIRLSFLNLLDILILWIACYWLIKKKEKKDFFWKIWTENKLFIFSFLLILAGFLISTLKGANVLPGLGIIKSWIILPFVFGVIIYDVFYFQKKLLVFRFFFYSSLGISLVSLLFFIFGKLTYDFRLMGIFNSPNYLAMYITPGFLWGIFYVINFKNKLSKKEWVFILASLLLMAWALLLTKSYASWLAALVVFFLTSLFFLKKHLIKITIISLLVLVLIINTQGFANKLSERASVKSRLTIWKSAGIIVEDNYLWGIGPSNFQEKYLEYQKFFPPYLEWAVPHAHNVYLNFWLSGGVFALVGWLGIILSALLRFIKKSNKKALTGVMAILLYFLIHGLVDTTYFKNDLAIIFWLAYFRLL